MGTVNHDSSIESYVFTEGQDIVHNVRTFFVAADGISNSKSTATHHYGGGSVLNDSNSVNICARGSIVNSKPVKNVMGRLR